MYSLSKLNRITTSTHILHCTRSISSEWDKPSGVDTGITVYNPLVRRTTPLIVNKDRVINWYVCGPTVYDSSHVGHASSYVRLDTIRRILNGVFGCNVIYMMGLTDVDDKIIKKSQESGTSIQSIAQHYESDFFLGMSKLRVTKPTLTRRVTESIPEIIGFVQTLIDSGAAYSTEKGNVYFNTENDSSQGLLYEDNSSMVESGYQADSAPDKRRHEDFVLWKNHKPGEPSWKSPWGDGRPGWHVECSAMASQVFGSAVDMHSGGIDLVFPHHQNELAQSNAYHCCSQWVNYWLHTGVLTLPKDEEKMSKSLGNTMSIDSMLKSYTANQFRLFCLLTKYRNNVEFGAVQMEKPVRISKQINSYSQAAAEYLGGSIGYGDVNSNVLYKSLEVTSERVREALASDFDTPSAIRHIMALIHVTNIEICKSVNKKVIKARSIGSIAAVTQYLRTSLQNLGLQFEQKDFTSSSEDDMQKLGKVIDSAVSFRQKVRSYARGEHLTAENPVKLKALCKQHMKVHSVLLSECDQMRSELRTLAHIAIKDQPGTASWYFDDKTSQDTSKPEDHSQQTSKSTKTSKH